MTDKTDQDQDFWTIGRKPVQEILFAKPEQVDLVYIQNDVRSRALERIVDICKSQKVRFRMVSAGELQRIHSGNHQGALARIFQPGFTNMGAVLEQVTKAPLPLVLALDQVQDPGNLGTLARTMVALGGAGMILPKNRTAFPGTVAAKAGAGALNKLPIAHVTNLARSLDYCREQGFTVYGCAVDAEGENMFRMIPAYPSILVLGNEDKGIRPNVLKRCDHKIFIPMPGIMQSLNVAQAGAIALGMFAKTRDEMA
ncbi:TrmH family RNA methyltransferase [Desulfonatronum thiosulfatophilum]|nr:RNA methyltransferase [Desulfonatronum thiosulfatophilum]